MTLRDSSVKGGDATGGIARGRLHRLVRRFGPTFAATLLSQGMGALSLFSLALLGPERSDPYSLGYGVGNAAYAGIMLQVVYLIALGRPWFSGWRFWSWISFVFSVAYAGVVAGFHYLMAGGSREAVAVILIYGIGGGFLAIAGGRAVHRACLGDPRLMMSVTVLPNAALTLAAVAIYMSGSQASWAMLAPAICWAATTPVLAWWVLRRPLPPFDPSSVPEGDKRSQGAHAVALTVGVLSNTVIPGIVLTGVTQLAAGVTTILFMVTKIGGSLVNLVVGSVLAVRHNWRTDAESLAPAAGFICLASSIVGLGALGLDALGLTLPSYIALTMSWSLALIAAPIVLRELNARRLVGSLVTKTAVDLVVSVAIGLWFILQPSVSGYFGTIVIMQAITVVISGFALRRPVVALSGIPLVALALAQIAIAW